MKPAILSLYKKASINEFFSCYLTIKNDCYILEKFQNAY